MPQMDFHIKKGSAKSFRRFRLGKCQRHHPACLWTEYYVFNTLPTIKRHALSLQVAISSP